MSEYIDELYRELLGRPVGPADMEAGRWAGHSEDVVRQGILNSEEYRNRNPSPSMFGGLGGFMSGFGMPSGSSSALDGILKKLYEFQHEQMQFMFENYKGYQLPYEQDYWKYARENLPAFSDQAVRAGEANTLTAEQAAALGQLRLNEEQQLTGPRTDFSDV
jgi:hypothetical protein